MIATTGKDAASWYDELTGAMGKPYYTRVDLAATTAQKNALQALKPESLTANELAGEAITAKLTHAPGNGAAIGGLKVASKSGWFAVRPSGTEDLCKIYAESLRSEEHLIAIKDQAAAIVQAVFSAAKA